MVDITQIDHVEEGLSKLPAQWDDATNIRGILESWLTPLNTTDEQLIDVRDGFNICSAIGAQLDIIGVFFSIERLGRSDDDYRVAILTTITNSKGSGTPDDILNLADTLTETNLSRIWEHYPLSAFIGVQVETDLALPALLQNGFMAGSELIGVIFDPTEEVYIGNEGLSALALLETNLLDTIEVDTGSGDFDLEISYLSDELYGTRRSQFVDSSQDASTPSGWGLNYGNNYGGQSPPTFVPFADMADVANVLSADSSTFLPWAETAEFDPTTGTTNKIKPYRQFQDSGLKPRQPLPRQFFNWMMGRISDWLDFLYNQMAVDTIFYTTNDPTLDIPAAEAELGTRMGGTWDYLGSDTLGSVTAYIFRRTV